VLVLANVVYSCHLGNNSTCGYTALLYRLIRFPIRPKPNSPTTSLDLISHELSDPCISANGTTSRNSRYLPIKCQPTRRHGEEEKCLRSGEMLFPGAHLVESVAFFSTWCFSLFYFIYFHFGSGIHVFWNVSFCGWVSDGPGSGWPGSGNDSISVMAAGLTLRHHLGLVV